MRLFLGVPIRVSSGWRSRSVNEAVGGADASAHLTGLAADLWVSPSDEIRSHIRALVLGGAAQAARIPRLPDDPPWPPTLILFLAVGLMIHQQPVDQLIHEGGNPGWPGWVHVAAARREPRRQILSWGDWSGRRYVRSPDLGSWVVGVLLDGRERGLDADRSPGRAGTAMASPRPPADPEP